MTSASAAVPIIHDLVIAALPLLSLVSRCSQPRRFKRPFVERGVPLRNIVCGARKTFWGALAPQVPRKPDPILQSRAASVLSGGAQIFVETGADVRDKKLFDVHLAPRKLLLVKVADEGFKRWPAALDGVIPDLRAEGFARRLKLVDHPWQTYGQRVCVVHPMVGDVARTAEGAIETDGEPRIFVVERLLQHECVHDRKYARAFVVFALHFARVAE